MQNGLEPTKESKNKKAMNVGRVMGLKSPPCHGDEETTKKHPDHTSALARLRKIKGQINGIEKMIEDKRYCVDILVQFRAIASALNVVETSIFERHIKNCVAAAIQAKSESEIHKKISELMKLISKRL